MAAAGLRLLLLLTLLGAAAPSAVRPWLAVLAADEVVLVDPEELKVVEVVADLDEPKALAISPDRRWLAASRPGRDQIQLLELSRKKVQELTGPTLLNPVGVAFSRDSQRLYVLSASLKALVELEPGLGKVNRVLALLGPEPSGMVASPDGERLLIVSEAGTLAEVDLRRWSVVRHDNMANPIGAVAWAGETLLVALPSLVKVLDPARERSVSLSETAVGLAGPGLILTRQELIRFDPADGQIGWKLAVGSHPVALSASPDGRWAFVADSESRDLQVVDLAAGAERTRMALQRVPTGLRWVQ